MNRLVILVWIGMMGCTSDPNLGVSVAYSCTGDDSGSMLYEGEFTCDEYASHGSVSLGSFEDGCPDDFGETCRCSTTGLDDCVFPDGVND